MHELHLVRDLVQDLLKNAGEQGVKRITSVTIRLGAFSEINPDVLRHHLAENSSGTIAAGAALILEEGAPRELRLVSYEGET